MRGMKLGLHLSNFTPAGPATIGQELAAVARAADDAGFTSISVMDHFWQIGMQGPPEEPMLEAYTTLGFLAAHTTRARLLALVTGVVYREPGLLAKLVSTLDVLSGGRAELGIGAAWNEEEAHGLGLPFPPLAERFERLEETLEIVLQMWSDDDGPYEGHHYQLDRTLNSPQPLTRPHPPITIGGSGEKKTLRLVAQYADACNLFPSPDVAHKLEVLRGHCERLGRPYEEITKTVVFHYDLGDHGDHVDKTIEQLAHLAELGFDEVHGMWPGAWRVDDYAYFAERIIPAVAEL